MNRFSFTAATRRRLPYGKPTFFSIRKIRPVSSPHPRTFVTKASPSGFQSVRRSEWLKNHQRGDCRTSVPYLPEYTRGLGARFVLLKCQRPHCPFTLQADVSEPH